MALVSYTRIITKPEPLTAADLVKVRAQVADAFGQIAVKEIQRDIWAESRFKRTTGKSTRAWRYKVEGNAAGLLVYNIAVNRKGTNYPKFVHLAGRPRSERLMLEVETYAQKDLAARLGRALAYAGFKARQQARKVTTKEVFNG